MKKGIVQISTLTHSLAHVFLNLQENTKAYLVAKCFIICPAPGARSRYQNRPTIVFPSGNNKKRSLRMIFEVFGNKRVLLQTSGYLPMKNGRQTGRFMGCASTSCGLPVLQEEEKPFALGTHSSLPELTCETQSS